MTTNLPLPTFKVMIFGGRDFNNYKLLIQVMADLHPTFPGNHELQIISGMAKGADALAVKLAEDHQLQLLEYPANWRPNGVLDRGAGYRRNTLMAKACDMGIGFWDQRSRGTRHSITELVRLNKTVHVINY